jgi:hypothetical protein
VSADYRVHELWWDFARPGWHDTDLTTAAGAPTVANLTGLVGYVSDQDGHQHIIFESGGNHIHEIWWDFAHPGWHDTDLTFAAA